MKKIFILLLCSFVFKVNAQTPIILTRADFPRPTSSSVLPDSVLYTNVPIAGNTVDIITTGASTNWNTLPLMNGAKLYQSFLPMSSTPLVFQLAFLTCDFAQPLLGNAGLVGNLPISDAYEYYNYASADSRLEIKGFGANVTIPGQPIALPLPAIYTSPDVIYKFPLAFGNNDSSLSGYSVTIPLGAPIGDIEFKRKQKRVNEADGWGSITTPAGTFDVLRVKSSIDRIDSIITVIAPLGFPSKLVEIKWLGSTKKIPVFQVNGNDLGGNVTPSSITFWGQEPNGILEKSNISSIHIFPNPAEFQASIEYSLVSSAKVSILLNNMKGETLAQFHFANQSAGLHRELLPLQGLTAGIYQITCIANGNMIHTKLLKR